MIEARLLLAPVIEARLLLAPVIEARLLLALVIEARCLLAPVIEARCLLALGVTLLVEALALAILRGRRRDQGDLALMNLLTNPIANAIRLAGLGGFLQIELGVLVAETLGMRFVSGIGWQTALTRAAILNGVSASLSFLI